MFVYLGCIWALGLGSIWALFGLYLGSRLGCVVLGLIGLQYGGEAPSHFPVAFLSCFPCVSLPPPFSSPPTLRLAPPTPLLPPCTSPCLSPLAPFPCPPSFSNPDPCVFCGGRQQAWSEVEQRRFLMIAAPFECFVCLSVCTWRSHVGPDMGEQSL